MDDRKRRTEHAPILIDGAVVDQVESIKFLGVYITNKLEMVQTHQHSREEGMTSLFPLRRLKRYGMGPQTLKRFYSCNREHPDWLHHCLVQQRLSLRPQGTTEGNAYGPVHHWG